MAIFTTKTYTPCGLALIHSSRSLEDLRSLWDFLKTSGISYEQSGAAEICQCPQLKCSRVSARTPPPRPPPIPQPFPVNVSRLTPHAHATSLLWSQPSPPWPVNHHTTCNNRNVLRLYWPSCRYCSFRDEVGRIPPLCRWPMLSSTLGLPVAARQEP